MNYELVTDLINQALADTHTATVARVTAINGTTINAKPVIARVVDDEEIPLPEFLEVPVINIQGGGSYLAMPIAIGDYCLLIFSERCFDNWYAGSDEVRPLEERMHDYSDGFALVGINPQASAIPVPSVITLIGDATIEGNHTIKGNHDHTGNITVKGDVSIDGNLTVTGTISAGNFTGLGGGAMTSTSDIISAGISLQNHVHGGVERGGSNTGGPK